MDTNEQWRVSVVTPDKRLDPTFMRTKHDALDLVRAHLADAVRWGEGIYPELPDDVVYAAFLMGTRMLSDFIHVETGHATITIEKVTS